MVGSISLISGFVSVGSLTPLEILLRTSSPLILPRGPVPLISLRDSPLFDAILRAAGEARILSGCGGLFLGGWSGLLGSFRD